MLKFCDKVICKPSFKIFMSFMSFLLMWKMANVIPIHQKKSKQLMWNYRPISSLQICGKILDPQQNLSLTYLQ